MVNPFFKNNGPFKYADILKVLDINIDNVDSDLDILDIKDLLTSNHNEITFYHSIKYKDIAKNTQATFCITTEKLKNELPKNCKPIIVNNSKNQLFMSKIDSLYEKYEILPSIIKDSRLTKGIFNMSYKNSSVFIKKLRDFDKERIYQSEISRRLEI